MSIDFRDAAVVRNIFRGRVVKLYRVTQDALPATRAAKPGTKIAMGDQLTGQFRPKAVKLGDTDAGGTAGVTGVANVKTITVDAVPADGETVTIAGTALTFDGSTPTANQVDTTSGTAAGVATQLAQEINQQIATVTATVNDDTVTITHNSTGTEITIVDGTSGDLTIAEVTPEVAAVAAQNTMTISGTHVENTAVSLLLYGITVNGVKHDVYLQTIVQSGDTATTIAARIVSLGQAIQSGSAAPANTRYFCTDPDASAAQIRTGVQAKYGTNVTNSTGFGNASGVITVKALASLGATGTDFTIGGVASPGPATEITFDTNGVPQLAGVQGWGYTTDFAFNAAASKSDINADQKLQPISRTVTGVTAACNFNLLCDEESELLAAASGVGDVAHTASREQFLPNFNDSIDSFGFIVVCPDGRFDGEFWYGVLYECEAGGVAIGRQLRANAPVPVELTINAVEGGDDIGFFSRYRPAVVPA